MFLRIFTIFLVTFLSLRADYLLELNDTQDVYSVNKGVLYFEDTKAELKIDDILKDKMIFKTMQKNELNLGFTASVFWFKLPLINHSQKQQKQWWIDIDYSLLDDIQIYQDVQGELSLLLHSGDNENFVQRDIAWSTYTAVLDPSKDSIVYIRVQTQSAMHVPIKIYNTTEIVKVKQGETLFYGFFYGVLLLIIFYNLFSYLVWNDRSYLYYVMFIAFFILWQSCLDGLGHQYLWPDIKWLSEKGALLFISLTIFSSVLFTRSFLHLREYAPRLNKILIALQNIMLVVAVSSFLFSYSIMIQVLVWLVFPIPLLLLFAGVLALKHKYRYARFYIVGWTLFLSSSVLLALSSLGYIEGYSYIKYIQKLGALGEVIFFSLALAERINILRQQNTSTLSRLNSRLQSEVHEKVSEIREKDELLMQKFRLATMGEMLENISHQWKQPLHKLSLVIQNFYFKNKLGSTTEDELEDFNLHSTALLTYMSDTIDDFRNFFNPQKDKENFDIEKTIEKIILITSSSMKSENINIEIEAENQIIVNGYENEFGQVLLNLFSNAKDALKKNKPDDRQIKIKIYETHDQIIIKFRDNAGGIDKEVLPKIFDPYFSTKAFKEGSGIGLYMSKMIVENSMQGHLNVANTTTGAEFSIELSKVL